MKRLNQIFKKHFFIFCLFTFICEVVHPSTAFVRVGGSHTQRHQSHHHHKHHKTKVVKRVSRPQYEALLNPHFKTKRLHGVHVATAQIIFGFASISNYKFFHGRQWKSPRQGYHLVIEHPPILSV